MNANISRRSLAKGAAWAVPAIAATTMVPVYAASRICSSTAPTTTINWNTYTRTSPSTTANAVSTNTGTVKTTDGLSTVSITHQSSTGPSLSTPQDMMRGGADAVSWSSYSGMSNYLFFQRVANNTGIYHGGTQSSTITFTSSQPVKDLTFTIGDVDQASTWQDVFKLSGSYQGEASEAPVLSGGATLSTSGNTSTITANKTDVQPGYNTGNVKVTYPGYVDSITIVWTNGMGRTGSQNFVIGETTAAVCNGA